MLELVVAGARLDGDDLAEGVRVLGLPDHEARLLAVGVDRVVSSRVVTVHGPLGASWSSVLEASGSLAMKSPWRIGRPRLPPRDLRAAAGLAQHAPLGVERRAVELVRLRQAAAAAAAVGLDRERDLARRVLDVAGAVARAELDRVVARRR